MDMVRTKPESVRLVAFSLRGYEDSSRFDESGMLPYHTIGRILGDDFISIVEYVVNVLDVPHNKGSSLSIMAWSLAAASVVAGYGALVSTSAATNRKWATNISKIVFYEPAGGRALGLNPWRNLEQKRQVTYHSGINISGINIAAINVSGIYIASITNSERNSHFYEDHFELLHLSRRSVPL
jgi:hypothetical protein